MGFLNYYLRLEKAMASDKQVYTILMKKQKSYITTYCNYLSLKMKYACILIILMTAFWALHDLKIRHDFSDVLKKIYTDFFVT